MSTRKCIKGFSSQYAYLSNNEYIHIDDYDKLNKQECLFCENKHELLYANCKKK